MKYEMMEMHTSLENSSARNAHSCRNARSEHVPRQLWETCNFEQLNESEQHSIRHLPEEKG
jgi:hypothetical protein